MPTRRALLNLAGFAGLGALAYGGAALLRRAMQPDLVFETLPDLPGFRRVTGGPISGGATMLIGIDGADEGIRLDDTALCGHLFGAGRDPGKLQIAYFTDYRCVYCRKVSPMLAGLDDGVQITWHDLPLLGQVSDIGARAAVAAGFQGAYARFHDRFMGSPIIPTPPVLRLLADEAGIDGDRLLKDMASPRTQRHLGVTAALARRFGFIGTPALVVGRTAVLGGIDQPLLDRLITAERGAPGPC